MDEGGSSVMEWKPSRPVSRGAEEYHKAVVDSTYYMESLEEIGNIAKEKIKESDIVIDFGAGTGVSALSIVNGTRTKFELWLVDNSASWLSKAYDIFRDNSNVKCFLLEKSERDYATLSEMFGSERVNHVISANTIHLVPDLDRVFKGCYDVLKPGGSLILQSSNIEREGRENGVMMIDDYIKRVHKIALDIIRSDRRFEKYKKDLERRIEAAKAMRKFIFPDAKNLNDYMTKLKERGFKKINSYFKTIRVKYTDWIKFLKVRALQVGILPEVGGKDASAEDAKARDEIITNAAMKLFKELEENNPKADDQYLTSESVYITCIKPV